MGVLFGTFAFVCGVVILAGTYLWWFSTREEQARRVLHMWAEAGGYDLLQVAPDPITLSNEWATFSFEVLVRRLDGSERRAWVGCGGVFGAAPNKDHVIVRWHQ